MKIVLRLLFICIAAAAAPCALAQDTAMYSFADIYRLSVSGGAPQPFPIAEPQVRVAAVQAIPEVRFTVKPAAGPERWWLLLAGLAAAAWVAHRRLTRPY